MECNHIGIFVAVSLPVVNNAIVAEKHQCIKHRLYVDVLAVFFFRDKVYPRFIVGSTIHLFEEHLTRHQTATIFVGSIGPTTGRLEKAVVPRTEVRGVVPHRINISTRHRVAGIAVCTLTSVAHRYAHKHFSVFIQTGVKAVVGVHQFVLTNVRTNELDVGSRDTHGGELGVCGISAARLLRIQEKF